MMMKKISFSFKSSGYNANRTIVLLRQKSTTIEKSSIIQSHVNVMENQMNFWWDEKGPVVALHNYNKLRIPFVKDGVLKARQELNRQDTNVMFNDIKMLDVGCGGGIVAEALGKLGASVDGIDASKDLIDVAKKHLETQKGLNVTYTWTTIEEFSKTNFEVYDAVVLSEVIEHIEEKGPFMEKCISTLKPGGSLFITTFNRTFYAWFYGIFVAESVFKFIPKGTHEYRLFISPAGMENIIEKYNCKTSTLKGTHFNCFNQQWKWVNNMQLNYCLHAIKHKNN